MHNDKDFGPYGNIGLAVQAIQIYMPLSPKITLALWCPSIIAEITDLRRRSQFLQVQRTLGLYSDISLDSAAETAFRDLCAKTRMLDAIASRIETGEPIPADDENMLFFNSLQARWANQYVLASHDNFSLVRRMLKDFPGSERGPRFELA